VERERFCPFLGFRELKEIEKLGLILFAISLI
jgi:hypothetical protein